MNFFCTKEHFDEWAEQSGTDTCELFVLDAEDAFQVADIIFGRHEERVSTR